MGSFHKNVDISGNGKDLIVRELENILIYQLKIEKNKTNKKCTDRESVNEARYGFKF